MEVLYSGVEEVYGNFELIYGLNRRSFDKIKYINTEDIFIRISPRTPYINITRLGVERFSFTKRRDHTFNQVYSLARKFLQEAKNILQVNVIYPLDFKQTIIKLKIKKEYEIENYTLRKLLFYDIKDLLDRLGLSIVTNQDIKIGLIPYNTWLNKNLFK